MTRRCHVSAHDARPFVLGVRACSCLGMATLDIRHTFRDESCSKLTAAENSERLQCCSAIRSGYLLSNTNVSDAFHEGSESVLAATFVFANHSHLPNRLLLVVDPNLDGFFVAIDQVVAPSPAGCTSCFKTFTPVICPARARKKHSLASILGVDRCLDSASRKHYSNSDCSDSHLQTLPIVSYPPSLARLERRAA